MSLSTKVFKVETFGAVDGPGIRLVIFVCGCNLRCKYCHNPESWDSQPNSEIKSMSIIDIINLYKRNHTFYEKGGITISGGEPMLNWEFIYELGLECKKQNIHLCIDTSACNFVDNQQAYEKLIDLIDLWIVDVKSLDPQEHEFLTGSNQLLGLKFINYLENNKKPYWLRQVIVKGINDDTYHLDQLASFIKSLHHCEKYELLSFHNLAIAKYEKLNLTYPFKNQPLLSSSEFLKIQEYLANRINK